jgi:hypothetical protein
MTITRVEDIPDPPPDPRGLYHLRGVALSLRRHGQHLARRCREVDRLLHRGPSPEALAAIAEELHALDDVHPARLPDVWEEPEPLLLTKVELDDYLARLNAAEMSADGQSAP